MAAKCIENGLALYRDHLAHSCRISQNFRTVPSDPVFLFHFVILRGRGEKAS